MKFFGILKSFSESFSYELGVRIHEGNNGNKGNLVVYGSVYNNK